MSFIKKNFLLLLVVVLASLFRLTNLDLIEFKADEGINLFLASRPVFGHPFPPGGTVSSVGVTNFPLVNYLLFPMILISLDPKIISFFIALLNVFAIGAFFIILRKYYNQTIAFVASSLIATSPWAILFSRKIWAQDFLFPILIPFILSIYKVAIDRDGRYWLLFAVSSLFLTQIHQSALFFIIPLTAFMLINKSKVNLKYLTAGLILGIIPTIHFVYYQLKTGCFDCQMAATYAGRINETSIDLLFQRPFQILSQGNFSPILGEDIVYFVSKFPLAYYLKQLYYIEYLLLPLGIFLFYKTFKKTGFLIFPVLLLPLIYTFLKLEPHLHYYLIATPFLYLFLATSFYYFFSNKNVLIKNLSRGLFAAIIIFSLYYNFAFYETVRDLKNIKGDYGQIFSETDKNTKRDYKGLKNDSYYGEMIIASYVPYSLTHGDIGIARMLYDAAETEKNMKSLEERLRKIPIDRRVQNELIAYYTREIPTKETIELLTKKSEEIPGYIYIYGEVLNVYNESLRNN